MKALLYAFSFLLFALHISCEDEYVDFTKEQQKLMIYEVGDQVSFLREKLGDTLIFEVESKTTTYNKIVNPFSLSLDDCYLPVCTTVLRNSDYLGKIVFLMLEDYDITSEIIVESKLKTIFQGTWGIDKDSVLSLDEIYYTNCEPFVNSDCDSLLYSKNKGIVYFTSVEENEIFTSLD